MIIKGMMGLGDNIYQRAFVKKLTKPVFIQTPWAEIYQDLPYVYPVKPYTTLRTQAKNIRNVQKWYPQPPGRETQISYGKHGIIEGMSRCFGVSPDEMDLPNFGKVQTDMRYAVIRPVTVRTEWRADSRNPLPEYVNEAAKILRQRSYKVVSVADLQDNLEWIVGEEPEADVKYHRGELSVTQLLSLIKYADVVVGGVGWIVPAAIATKTRAWIINGGCGGYNAKDKITHPSLDLSKIKFIEPDRFCRCFEHNHRCDKHISNHANQFAKWL